MEVNPFKFKYETIKYKLEIINKIIAKYETESYRRPRLQLLNRIEHILAGKTYL